MHIVVENLRKELGGRQVLDGISLDIPKGELCFIVGASGTGKSVLLKHLVGLMKPDSGRILIDGQDTTPLSEARLLDVRKRFGMIFQGGGLLDSLTVGENVGLALAEVRREKPERVRAAVAEKLALVGLEGRESQMPGTLSGGQIKRAAIARALTTNAECLLFDEPTAGLDPLMSDNIDDVIADVNRRTGATTIVVTHDLVSVFKLARRVHFLHGGKVLFSGTPEELRASSDATVKAFLARETRGMKDEG